MADEAKKAVADIKELLKSQKLLVGETTKTTEAIRKAPAEALRVEVDKNGNGLLHQVVCILRDRYLKSDVSNILKEIIRKDPESVHKTNCHGQLALHLACEYQQMTDYYEAVYGIDVINVLLEANPLSRNVSDKKGRLPLHFFASKYWGVNWGYGKLFGGIFNKLITEGTART